MFTKSFLQELRDRISLVSAIGERVPLKKAGRHYRGLCPFHVEKTPSFFVNEEKQIFHCFGCAEGGDVVHFIMKFEGLSFPEAVRLLADRAGLPLPKDEFTKELGQVEAAREKRRKWSLRMNEVALDAFIATLLHPEYGQAARDYMATRGISKETMTQHFLGFADKGAETLVRKLTDRGAPLDLAAELGLIRQRPDGQYYDFFRNRIIFAIRSARGEILAFGGRTIDAQEQVKYLNSPDSPLFHKSTCVYGLDRAKAAIRQQDELIVVEGYLDVLSLVEAGIAHVVAPLGTALTEGHVRLLGRYTKRWVMMFDGDEAGRRAQIRSLPIFLESGLMPRAVALPQDDDPDSFVRREGKEGILGLMKQAPSLFEFFLEWTIDQTGLDPIGRAEAARQVLPMLEKVKDPVEQALYRQVVARRLHVEESAIAAAMQPSTQTSRSEKAARIESAIVIPHAERVLIEAMVREPEAIARTFARLSVKDFSDEWCRNVAGLLQQWNAHPSGHVNDLFDTIEDAAIVEELRALAMEEVDETNAALLIDDCIARIERRSVEAQMDRLNEEIQKVEARRDDVALFRLLGQKQELLARLNHPTE